MCIIVYVLADLTLKIFDPGTKHKSNIKRLILFLLINQLSYSVRGRLIWDAWELKYPQSMAKKFFWGKRVFLYDCKNHYLKLSLIITNCNSVYSIHILLGG